MVCRWVVVAVLLVASACTDSSNDAVKQGFVASSGAPTTRSGAPPALTEPVAVSRVDIVAEDASRPTAADSNRDLPEKSSRTLPLMILIPDGAGPFPVVEFSHGVTSSGPVHENFLRQIASAGYIVVAPTFPLSSGERGTIFDYVNQPLDAYFALDEIIRLGSDASDPLYGRVDSERVALAGHSLGAMTTLGAAFNSCCTRPDIDAVISVSGVEAPIPGGDFVDRPPLPLLLVHGDQDPTIRSSSSDDLYLLATGPTAFLRFPNGGHGGMVRPPDGDLTAKAIVAWLDRWLRDDGTRLAALPAVVDASGVATYTTKGF